MTPLTDAEREELTALLATGDPLPEKWRHRLFPNGRKGESVGKEYRLVYEGKLTREEVLLQELLRFARYHAAFSIGLGGPPELREPLARLRRLVDVPATLVMRLFDCQDVRQTLNIDQFAQALSLIESYVFRRAICGEQTRG